MNALKVFVFGIICFAVGYISALVTNLLCNRRTAPEAGERINAAKGTSGEIEQTAGNIADSVERSGNVIEEIRKQKIE